MKTTASINPVLVAINAAGSQLALSKLLTPPVSRQAIAKWLRKGEIPPRRVPQVSAATRIPMSVLNPLFKE